jgi:hypothetical protein
MAIKVNGVVVIDDSKNGSLESLELTGTSALKLPVGTTAQRPGTPVAGQLRYNSTTGGVESYTGISWVNITSAADEALVLGIMAL